MPHPTPGVLKGFSDQELGKSSPGALYLWGCSKEKSKNGWLRKDTCVSYSSGQKATSMGQAALVSDKSPPPSIPD